MEKLKSVLSAMMMLLSANAMASSAIVGTFDEAIDSDCVIAGWAKDPGTTHSIWVDFYMDAPYGSPGSEWIGGTSATVLRTDLPFTDKNHGFNYQFPAQALVRDGNAHAIYVYGDGDISGVNSSLLSNSPRTLLCAPGPTVNVQNYGAMGNGSDATAAIASAIHKIPATGGVLSFPAGTYVVSGTNTLPSNTQIVCQNGAVIQSAPGDNWKGGVNEAFAAQSGGANFEVSGCSFKYPYGNPNYNGGAAHVLGFLSVENVKVLNNTFDGGGDAVAEVGTTNTLEEGNTATNVSNACFDHWGGFTNAQTINNYCTTLPSAGIGVGGIQFTGIATNGAAANSSIFVATGNTIYINNGNGPACIVINADTSGGLDNNGTITHNTCVIAGGRASWGILVTGVAMGGTISGNVLEGDGGYYAAVAVYPPASGWNVQGNASVNWWNPSTAYPVFLNEGASGTLTNNNSFSSCSQLPSSLQPFCKQPNP